MHVFTFAKRPDLADRADEVPEAFPSTWATGRCSSSMGKLRERLPELQLMLWDEERDAVAG